MKTIEEKIKQYYSLKPTNYPVLVKFELKQNLIADETPTIDLFIILQSRDRNESKCLNIVFEGIRELILRQSSLSEFHIPFINIDSIKDSQWEGLDYKVKDEEEDTFSFMCKNFEAAVC